MGLICSPNYAQEVMENNFRNVEDAEVYIDNIGAFSQSWDDHIALLHNHIDQTARPWVHG